LTDDNKGKRKENVNTHTRIKRFVHSGLPLSQLHIDVHATFIASDQSLAIKARPACIIIRHDLLVVRIEVVVLQLLVPLDALPFALKFPPTLLVLLELALLTESGRVVVQRGSSSGGGPWGRSIEDEASLAGFGGFALELGDESGREGGRFFGGSTSYDLVQAESLLLLIGGSGGGGGGAFVGIASFFFVFQ
jgi:hypothetical protein